MSLFDPPAIGKESVLEPNLIGNKHGGNRPRLCFIGPMVGRNPGLVTTQGMIVADYFASKGYSVLAASSSPSRYVRLLDIVKTLVKHRRDVDIQCLEIYAERSFVVETIASWLGKRFNQRLVMVLHGGTLPEFMDRFPRWSRFVLQQAHVLVSPSNYMARAVRARGFNARIIPNVIDLSQYPFRLRERVKPRLFWMRSFHPAWNPVMALRVLARLRATFPEATLVMAGSDMGLHAEVQRLAGEWGLQSAIRFPGFLNMEAKGREEEVADIYINTNRIDNMPVAVVEACAMGLPVVATSVGGIPDLLVDGETGLLVPDDDHEAMTDAIIRVLMEPGLAGRLSANGLKLAEQSSWQQVRPKWESLFEELMEADAISMKPISSA
jgi:glycosyltransferase involved in cell wall biosynthesis